MEIFTVVAGSASAARRKMNVLLGNRQSTDLFNDRTTVFRMSRSDALAFSHGCAEPDYEIYNGHVLVVSVP